MSLLHRHPSGRLERCRSRVSPCPFGGPVGQTLSRDRSGMGAPVIPDEYGSLPVMSSGVGKHIGKIDADETSTSVAERFKSLSDSERAEVMSKIDESLVKADGRYARDNFTAWREKVSDDEFEAVRRYTTGEYRKYNDWKTKGKESLSYPKYGDEEELRREQEIFENDVNEVIPLLDFAFTKGESEPAMFYRGLGFRYLTDGRGSGTVSESESISDLMTRFPVGERVSHEGYVSTSSDEKVAKTFAERSSNSMSFETSNPVSVIMRVRGRSGVSVSSFAYRANESEFIFNAPMVIGGVSVEGKRKKILVVDVFEESLLEDFLK